MTADTSAAAARKKLIARIAAAQKQADAAKKGAKLAKLAYHAAKAKFKEAKRAAKKLRKAVGTLEDELKSIRVRKAPQKQPGRKPAVKRPKPAPVESVHVEPLASPVPPPELPPVAPV